MPAGVDGGAAEEAGRAAGGANPQAFGSQGLGLLHSHPEADGGLGAGVGVVFVAFEGVDDEAVGFAVVLELHLSGRELLLHRVAAPGGFAGGAGAFLGGASQLFQGALEVDAELEELFFFQPDEGLGAAGCGDQPEGAASGASEGFGGDGAGGAEVVACCAVCHSAAIIDAAGAAGKGLLPKMSASVVMPIIAIPTAADIPTAAERALRRRIGRGGPITFAEYMDGALYGPGGYYTRAAAGADYYTSPQVHPAFGALLAVQAYGFWMALGGPHPFNILEAGAGDGLLCRDILTAAQYLPAGFGEAARYILCDRRGAAGWERGFPNARRIAGDALRMPSIGAGCIIANELLDALPVHRVRMEGGRLRELYVGLAPDAADGYEAPLVELAGAPSTGRLQRRLDGLGVGLAEGQTAEICLQLDDWGQSIAGALDAGFVLAIDYGRAAADLYDPAQRLDGTLVTYRGHRQTDAPLRDAGRQDITAQVDFTSAARAGEAAGLTTIGGMTQGQLLHRLGLQTIRRNGAMAMATAAGSDGGGRAWLAALTHLARPGGLGDFGALLQSKGVAPERAAALLAWVNGDGPASPSPASLSPASLSALIPPDALTLGAERTPVAG